MHCDIEILKYMALHGGIDMNYKSGYIQYIYYYNDDDNPYSDNYTIIDINCILYRSIYNSILYSYYTAIGSYKLINQIIQKLNEQEYENLKLIEDNKRYEVNEEIISYIKDSCKIFNIDFTLIETGYLELPSDLHDISLLPKDNKLYNWNYDRENE